MTNEQSKPYLAKDMLDFWGACEQSARYMACNATMQAQDARYIKHNYRNYWCLAIMALLAHKHASAIAACETVACCSW